MKDSSQKNNEFIVELIDKLAPLNNKFRITKNSVEKIEILWDLGQIIDAYLSKYDLKLHELLYQVYDPHSTIKKSYITRDVGSYSYRIFKYFKNKEEINNRLSNLKSYTLFREAIPLLFNDKYNLNKQEKDKIIDAIISNKNQKNLINELRKRKKDILPISNPRNQKSQEFQEERLYLRNLLVELRKFYGSNESLLATENIFGDKQSRVFFVIILMALASDLFLNKINLVDPKMIDKNQKKLLLIAKSNNINRARFRKWVMTSTELLQIAEAIHSLDNKEYYVNFKNKFINNE